MHGFSEHSDVLPEDIKLWHPSARATHIPIDMVKYILTNVGDIFCSLIEQEMEAMSWVATDCPIFWKRPVPGTDTHCSISITTVQLYLLYL